MVGFTQEEDLDKSIFFHRDRYLTGGGDVLDIKEVLLIGNTVHSQNAVTAYLSNEKLLYFDFAEQSTCQGNTAH